MARILIVDDSAVARKALRDIVTGLGHTVEGEATNGTQAFVEYAKCKPDIVTMDLGMEGMNGAEATSKIIATYPNARIIVISAMEESKVVIDALERGARHYIIKPVIKEKVESIINNVLQQNFDIQKHRELVRKFSEADKLYFAANKQGLQQGGKELMARILIVDDSAVARKALREIVTTLGHTVIGEAENGTQAFVEYSKCKPDVVTMDMTMQGMSGAEATTKIITTNPDARIIVISAIEERHVIIDALERGARHFIIKPITQQKVESILNNVLKQSFDMQKHLELVRKLKGADDSGAMVGGVANHLPPYYISIQDNKMVLVEINPKFTLTSCQSLNMELEEYLSGKPRVLFDFKTTSSLSRAILAEIGKLIKKIEDKSGMVKAVSRNQCFVDIVNAILEESRSEESEGEKTEKEQAEIKKAEEEKVNVHSLAAVLRYFA